MAITQKDSKDIVIDYMSDYARYVATSRAIPALMDGFKPVQRRFLVSARDLKLWNRGATLKSAKLSGEVAGNYHPHGDAYGALANMVQDFKQRYPQFEGQGNWGCSDLPDSVAASRYTEVKLSKFGEEFYLSEADYGDYDSNYDGRLNELVLMYPKLPGVLLTGASGIAIGLSTNIPMHTIKDLSESLLAYIADPTSEDYLDKIVPETAEASIIETSRDDIKKIYRTGQGSIKYRAKTHYETVDGKPALVVDSFPPEFSKKRLQTANILDAVDKGKLELINESKSNIRYVFISDDKGVLQEIEERLTNSQSYRFYIDHRGVIKMYTLQEIYQTFLQERADFIVRKYTDVLAKVQYELDYLNVLLLLKQDKQYIKDMFDKTSDEVVADIITRYNTTDKIARRVIQASLRSLMADNLQQIQDEINKYNSQVAEYQGYIADPNAKIVSDLQGLIQEFSTDDRRARLEGDTNVAIKVTYKGDEIEVGEYDEYILASKDNQITKVMGVELQSVVNLDDYVALLPADKKYYFAWDCRGITGMEKDVLLKSGNKFKSDSLSGVLAVDDLNEIEVTLGSGKVERMKDWCLRKRAGWTRMADDDQPCIQVKKV